MKTVLPGGDLMGPGVAEPLREIVARLVPAVLLEVILLLVPDTVSAASALY